MKTSANIVTACLILFTGTTVGECGPGIEEGGCFSDGDCEDCHRCAAGRCILVESLLNPCGECGPAPEEVCGDDVDNDCDTATDEADCVDPCEGVVCDHPPNECYQSTGTCRNRTCHYDFNDGARCDDGDPCTTGDVCNHGACTGTQMTCDSPPRGECVDQITWREYGADTNWVDSSFVVKGRLVHTSLISTARKRNWRWNWMAGVMQRKSKLPTMWKGPHTCSIPVFKCYVFGTIKCSKSQKRFCKRYGTHCTLCHPHPNPPASGRGSSGPTDLT